LRETVLEGHNLICEDCGFYGDVTIGRYSTLGPRCVVHGKVNVGRFCQIASSVALYAIDHSTSHITTYVSKSLFNGALKRYSTESGIVVGHDVWIGHGCIVLKGVKIGNGAIIGAGSVVTRDVPRFTIVAGNPARILHPRFGDDIIELIEQLEWWNLSSTQLEEIKHLFLLDFVNEKAKSMTLLEEAVLRLNRR
jgi:virginiamycin A acetyltransferase